MSQRSWCAPNPVEVMEPRTLLSAGNPITPLHKVDPPVHQYIIEQAIKLFNSQAKDFWAKTYFNLEGMSDFGTQLETASHDEDTEFAPWGGDISLGPYKAPYLEHFYDPNMSDSQDHLDSIPVWGDLSQYKSDDSAEDRAEQYWNDYALAEYGRANPGLAWYYLGRLAHLVADMTVPAHVHLDPHFRGNTDAYEEYVSKKQHYATWTAADAGTSIPPFADVPSLFKMTAEVTDDFDSDDFAGEHDNTGHKLKTNVTDGNCNAYGDTLMPLAFRATAALFKMFAREVRPTVDLTGPSSTREDIVTVDASPVGYGDMLIRKVQFQTSTNGSDWSSVGADPSDIDGWVWHVSTSGLAAGKKLFVRARALDDGGLYSKWKSVAITRLGSNVADLAVSDLSFGPETIRAGSHPSEVSFTLKNNGPAALNGSRTFAEFYLSRDTTFSVIADVKFGDNGYTMTLPSGGTRDVILSSMGMSYLTIPSDASGQYYVFVKFSHSAPSTLQDNKTWNNRARTVGTITVSTPPPNDNFAGRINIDGATATVSGTNVDATAEAGEPNHADAGWTSVWWTWTAPWSESVQIDTSGSSFDTLLGVYTGDSVADLTLVASDDQSGIGDTSLVTFDAVAGTTYQIAVDGYQGATGDIRLNVALQENVFADITTDVTPLPVRIYDSWDEDGDVVDIWFNGELIADDLMLTIAGETFYLPCVVGENDLVLQDEYTPEGAGYQNTGAADFNGEVFDFRMDAIGEQKHAIINYQP